MFFISLCEADRTSLIFTITYRFSKIPNARTSEKLKVKSEKVKSRLLTQSGFLVEIVGIEPMTS